MYRGCSQTRAWTPLWSYIEKFNNLAPTLIELSLSSNPALLEWHSQQARPSFKRAKLEHVFHRSAQVRDWLFKLNS